MMRIRAMQALGLVLVASAIPACVSSNPNRAAPQPSSGITTEFKVSMLSGGQEVPPVVTTATGSATVTLNPNLTEVAVTLTFSGLSNITEAHIHVGPPGVDGPIIFTLASAGFTSPLTVTLGESDFMPAPEKGVISFDLAVQEIQNGNTYINVHTTAFPDGEIRGAVGIVFAEANLSGAQEVPTVVSLATGLMALTLSADQTTMSIVLTQTGITNVTAANIHAGALGADGPIIFPLAGPFYQVPLNVILTASDFTPQPGAGVATFEQAVDAILTGKTYVNVQTIDHPDGEIRGQIIPHSSTGIK